MESMEESPVDPTVERASQGDADALEELLRAHGPVVQARLSINERWRRLLEPADVMQVTYLEAFLRVGALRARDASGFEAWLERIARNNLNDAVRALGRDKRPDGAHRITHGASANTERTLLDRLARETRSITRVASARESVEHLRVALERLPETYQHVVRTCDLEERPVSEVAEELGRSSGAVHMLRARAHDRLRELLADVAENLEESP